MCENECQEIYAEYLKLDFGAAWRKAVRRILNISPDTHNYLIPLLIYNALPFLDDVCKRSARFVFSCIQSD